MLSDLVKSRVTALLPGWEAEMWEDGGRKGASASLPTLGHPT